MIEHLISSLAHHLLVRRHRVRWDDLLSPLDQRRPALSYGAGITLGLAVTVAVTGALFGLKAQFERSSSPALYDSRASFNRRCFPLCGFLSGFTCAMCWLRWSNGGTRRGQTSLPSGHNPVHRTKRGSLGFAAGMLVAASAAVFMGLCGWNAGERIAEDGITWSDSLWSYQHRTFSEVSLVELWRAVRAPVGVVDRPSIGVTFIDGAHMLLEGQSTGSGELQRLHEVALTDFRQFGCGHGAENPAGGPENAVCVARRPRM